jgi:hypothetical protein
LFERNVHRIGSGAYCIDHGLPRSVCCSPGFLTGNARRLGGDPGFFAGDARRLSGVAQPLLLLSDCLKRFAMMVPDLTRFLRQAPELFRLIPGRLGGYAVFRKPTDIGSVTTVIHEITYRQRTGTAV